MANDGGNLRGDAPKHTAFGVAVSGVYLAFEHHRSRNDDAVLAQPVLGFLHQMVDIEMLGDLLGDPRPQPGGHARIVGVPTEIGGDLALVVALGVVAGATGEGSQRLDLQLSGQVAQHRRRYLGVIAQEPPVLFQHAELHGKPQHVVVAAVGQYHAEVLGRQRPVEGQFVRGRLGGDRDRRRRRLVGQHCRRRTGRVRRRGH